MTEEDLKHYLEERLYIWAEWYSRGNFYGLGYPSCSIEYRLMREGVLTRSTAPRPLPSNELAEEIEALVSEMNRYNHQMAMALRHQYFNRGSLRAKAKEMQISHMQFKRYVDMAEQWLIGRLTGQVLKPLYF